MCYKPLCEKSKFFEEVNEKTFNVWYNRFLLASVRDAFSLHLHNCICSPDSLSNRCAVPLSCHSHHRIHNYHSTVIDNYASPLTLLHHLLLILHSSHSSRDEIQRDGPQFKQVDGVERKHTPKQPTPEVWLTTPPPYRRITSSSSIISTGRKSQFD